MRGDGTVPTNPAGDPPPKNIPAPNAPSGSGPTERPSESGGTGGGGGSSTTTTSGQTPNTAITPEVTIGLGGGYFLGFQPISNTSWSSTTTNTVSCTGGNNGRAGGNSTVTSTTTPSDPNTNLGCTVTVGRTWEDVENDMEYTFEVQADIIKGNPGVSANFTMSF